MATRTPRGSKSQTEEASIPSAVQPPTLHAPHGGLDAAFVWQQLADIQKTLGAMDAKIDHQRQSVDKLENSLGKIKTDVSEFKQIRHTAKIVAWIVGVFLTIVLAIIGFLGKEAWHALKPFTVERIQQTTSAPLKP